jgi:hypothetical protein
MNQNDLTQINEGGTHSQNSLGGVPMGNGNSVEQGETKQDNFIYSDRIILDANMVKQFDLPKSFINKSIADATKIIDKKFIDRNDKISQSTKDSMLAKIAQVQEAMKPQPQEPQEPQQSQEQFTQDSELNMDPGGQMSMGGELDGAEGMDPRLSAAVSVLPSLLSGNKKSIIESGSQAGLGLAGTLIGGPVGGMIGSTIGKTVSPLISKMILGNKTTEAERNERIVQNSQYNSDFAYGGKMYADGGILDKLGPVPTADDLVQPRSIEQIKAYQASKGLAVDGDFGKNSKKQFALDQKNYQTPAPNLNGLGTSTSRFDKIVNPGISDNKIIGSTPISEQYLSQSLIDGDQGKINTFDSSKTLNKVGDTLGQAARYAPIAMNAYQLSQLKKPKGQTLDRLNNKFTPEYVDEQSLQNKVSNEYDNTVNAVTQMGGSQGATRNAILGAGLNKSKAMSEAYMNANAQNRQMNLTGQQFDLSVNQANLNQSNSEMDINDRNSAAYRNEKSKFLSEIGNGIGDVGKEEVYKDIAKKTTGYKWTGEYVKSPDGKVVTDPDTGKPMTQEKLKLIQTSKKALGGYLVNNKK